MDDSVEEVIREMDEFVEQEVEPDLDKIENWAQRLRALTEDD